MCFMVPGMINTKQVFIIIFIVTFWSSEILEQETTYSIIQTKFPVWMSSLINTPSVNFMLVMVKQWAKHFIQIVSLNLNLKHELLLS